MIRAALDPSADPSPFPLLPYLFFIFPSFAAFKAKQSAGPSAPGSKEVPEGQPNCLAGLKLVFTGELSSFSREESIELAKKYGA
jgi:replication factor C subunit 1